MAGALPSTCTQPCNLSLAPMDLHSLYQIPSWCQTVSANYLLSFSLGLLGGN